MQNIILAIISAVVAKIDFPGLMFLIASNIRVPWIKRVKLSPEELFTLTLELKHGDLLFGRREWFLKNLLVPGRYKHVAVWDAERKLVLEFQDAGYEENTLAVFTARYTEVCAFSTNFTPGYAIQFVNKLKSFFDKPYDKKYSKNTATMYCSESVHASDTEKRLQYEATPIFWFEVFIPHELTKLPTVKQLFLVKTPNLIYFP